MNFTINGCAAKHACERVIPKLDGGMNGGTDLRGCLRSPQHLLFPPLAKEGEGEFPR
jgi:hypothetical protein